MDLCNHKFLLDMTSNHILTRCESTKGDLARQHNPLRQLCSVSFLKQTRTRTPQPPPVFESPHAEDRHRQSSVQQGKGGRAPVPIQPGDKRLNGTAARTRKAALHLRRETMATTQTLLPC